MAGPSLHPLATGGAKEDSAQQSPSGSRIRFGKQLRALIGARPSMPNPRLTKAAFPSGPVSSSFRPDCSRLSNRISFPVASSWALHAFCLKMEAQERGHFHQKIRYGRSEARLRLTESGRPVQMPRPHVGPSRKTRSGRSSYSRSLIPSDWMLSVFPEVVGILKLQGDHHRKWETVRHATFY